MYVPIATAERLCLEYWLGKGQLRAHAEGPVFDGKQKQEQGNLL